MNKPPLSPRPGGTRARAVHRTVAGLAALVLTALATTASGTTPTVARTAADPVRAGSEPSRSEIYSELGLDRVPADYVVLVDISGSMLSNGRYSSVRSALLPFLKGLSPRDYVALFTFGDKAEPVYLGHPSDPKDIIGKLPAEAGPSNVQTDIGAALDRGLGELERPDAAEVGSIVMFTDGKHDPPEGSKYPKSDGSAWKALRARADKLAAGHELAAYSLPLATDETGSAQLARVVSNTSELRPESVQDLPEYLGRAAERSRARKAARMIAEDAGKGVAATLSHTGALDLDSGGAAATLTLTATTNRLPLTVTGLGATLKGQPLVVTGLPDRVSLKPGEARQFEVQVRGEPDAGPLPVRRTWTTEAGLTVRGKVTTPWAATLDDVKFAVPTAVDGPAKGLPLRAEVGSPLALPLLLGVPVAALLAALLLWLRRNRAALSGLLVLSPALGDGPEDRIVLRGQKLAFVPPQIGGSGRVYGRRFRADDGRRGIALHLRYSPDGTPARSADAVCPPGDAVVINGIRFAYRQDRDGQPSAAPRAGEVPDPLPIPRPGSLPPDEGGPWRSAPSRPTAQDDRPAPAERDLP
ncbi:vWA domain-containing protein [Streptomyces sp. DH10]|uniref:vWA domain-containing protein n=1 Tax=Streptomyces sp. DH10 TaxID=3040121 RepID=UPI002442E319|nr:VWA domain-containing protein [Streptomyces sp. DH10]MDG9710479.1 VWA domain-containing protein [Streptomyces sp. DH10]